MRILSAWRNFRRRRDRTLPLVEVRISRERLIRNAEIFSQVSKKGISPVLKANAYGHGLREVGRIFEEWGKAPFFSIDSLFEARLLRSEGLASPLLILGFTPSRNIFLRPMKKTSFAVVSLDHLKDISRHSRFPVSLHLKIDTGMHRHGVLPGELPEALSILAGNTHLFLLGVFSHFADADNADDASFTKEQIEIWNSAVEKVKRSFPALLHCHIAATAGVLFSEHIAFATAVRVGLGIYGIAASKKWPHGLLPALSLHSSVSGIKDILPGHYVGYGKTFRAQRRIKVGTIPAGYSEGIDRRLSNRGVLEVRGAECPIVGRVSMNITTIDVSRTLAEYGDEVVLISSDPKQKNSVEHIARECGTIPYEILVHIPAHLRRVVM